MVNKFFANLKRTQDTQHLWAHPIPYVFGQKNHQILVHGEQYANGLQMVQHGFADSSTHTCVWFVYQALGLQTPRRTRLGTRLVQTFIHMHYDKSSAMIIGATVYIAVNVKYTNFGI